MRYDAAKAQIGRMREEIDGDKERIASLERERDEIERKKAALLRSWSWRLTRPLRLVGKLFGRSEEID